jgi:creatinine amidohydrolase/Fe(II)-dependent formamide hydrolase-like protein
VVCPKGIADGTGREVPGKVLVLPTLWNGYTAHVMDFPGTLNAHPTTLLESVLDVTRSLAYHGFKKILLLNGHGSNSPILDLAARRTNLETDAECAALSWWGLLTVDKDFLPGWRESKFPGGCAHACELETSLYLYLDGANVRRDLIRDARSSSTRRTARCRGSTCSAPGRWRSSGGRARTRKPGCSASRRRRPPRRAGERILKRSNNWSRWYGGVRTIRATPDATT